MNATTKTKEIQVIDTANQKVIERFLPTQEFIAHLYKRSIARITGSDTLALKFVNV